ncbi:MAG TPA: hypothetical protein VKH43_12450 [Thermoanaerobaculia bacterium]|nr:hypothetical protein [Thermoanaerobaculia bacterium]
MKTRLLAAAFAVLAVSFAGCAHTGGGGGGGAYFGDCGFYDDCYGGPQYTCVLYDERPVAAPARMDIALAQRHHGPRTVGPRDSGPGTSSSGSSGSSVPSSSPTTSFSTVDRAPVVVASPSVDRGSPRVRN